MDQPVTQPEKLKSNKRRWDYIIPTIVFVIFVAVGYLVEDKNSEIGFLSLAAFPLIFIIRAVIDLRQPGTKEITAYIVIIFSLLVIGALVAAVVYELGQVHSTDFLI